MSAARPRPTTEGGWLVIEGDPQLIAVAHERSAGRHLPPDARPPRLGVLVDEAGTLTAIDFDDAVVALWRHCWD